MLNLIKNDIYILKKWFLSLNIIFTVIFFILSFIFKNNYVALILYIILLPLVVGITCSSSAFKCSNKYNLFINSVPLKKEYIVKGTNLEILFFYFIENVLVIAILFLRYLIDKNYFIKINYNQIIIIFSLTFFIFVMCSQGANYITFKFEEEKASKYRGFFAVFIALGLPQIFRLFDKINIFNKLSLNNVSDLSLNQILKISIVLYGVGFITIFIVNKLCEYNYSKREY